MFLIRDAQDIHHGPNASGRSLRSKLRPFGDGVRTVMGDVSAKVSIGSTLAGTGRTTADRVQQAAQDKTGEDSGGGQCGGGG